MLDGNSLEWLETMAVGVADGTVVVEDRTPTPSPVRDHAVPMEEPITAPFVTSVTEADLERRRAEAGKIIVDVDAEVDDPRVGKRGRKSDGEAGEKHKKKKSKIVNEDSAGPSRRPKSRSSSRRSKSSRKDRSLYLESEFVRRSAVEYEADPVMASFNVIAHLSDFVKKDREDAAAAIRGLEEKRDTEVALKEQAEADLKEVRATLRASENKVQSLRDAVQKNDELRGELVANRDRKFAEDEATIRKLKEKEAELEEKVKTLQARVADLEGSLPTSQDGSSSNIDPAARILSLEKLLKKQEDEIARQRANVKKAAQFSLQMREVGFKSAVDQMQVVNPGLSTFIGSVINLGHEVDGNQIVKVDKASKEKTLVYPAHQP